MKTNFKIKTLAAIAFGMCSVSAMAQTDAVQTVTVSGSDFCVDKGAMQTVDLGGWHYVKNIVVRAQGSGWSSGTIEVLANGDVKGTIHVPGNDPSFIVTIADTTSSLQFRQVEGGSVTIREVDATETIRMSPSYNPPGFSGNAPREDGSAGLRITNGATAIASRAIELVDQLNGFSDYSDEGNYLLPIKKTAARLYATARANSDFSDEVRTQMVALSNQIDFATPYIENYFERADAFDLATELLTLKEQINALMQ